MPFALITRLITGEAGLYFARLKSMAVWYAAMGVFLLVALVFLLIAIFAWIAAHLGVVATALIFTGVFLVLGIVALVVARVSGRPPRRVEGDNRLERDIASIAGVTAMANLRMLKRKRGLVIIPAAAAGFFGLYKFIAAMRER